MADNTTTTTPKKSSRNAEQQARIERVKRDLEWAIEQTVRDIRALEAYIAEHKQAEQQQKPQQRDGGDA